jgi:hypothetical protein
MPRTRATEPMVVHQVELERRLVLKGRVIRRMRVNERPAASSKMVINMIPEFVITAP